MVACMEVDSTSSSSSQTVFWPIESGSKCRIHCAAFWNLTRLFYNYPQQPLIFFKRNYLPCIPTPPFSVSTPMSLDGGISASPPPPPQLISSPRWLKDHAGLTLHLQSWRTPADPQNPQRRAGFCLINKQTGRQKTRPRITLSPVFCNGTRIEHRSGSDQTFNRICGVFTPNESGGGWG